LESSPRAIGKDPRWPEFAATAFEAGIMSTLSLPLVVAGDGLGALNIYCHEESGFSAADEALAMTFASYASVALANARVYWRTQRLADQLEEALSTPRDDRAGQRHHHHRRAGLFS
jgi:GAF domain-containing protein